MSPIRTGGDFYGKTWNACTAISQVAPERVVKILAALPLGAGEVACHPGYVSDLESDYRDERTFELAALSHPIIRAAVTKQNLSASAL